MVKRHFVIICSLFFTIFISSCNRSDDNIFATGVKELKLPKAVEIEASKKKFCGLEILNITDIQSFDTVLVIKGLSPSSEYNFHTFTIPENSYQGSFIAKGRGENEMLNPSMRGYTVNNQDEILVNMLDINLKAAYNWNLTQSISKKVTELTPSFELNKLVFNLIPGSSGYIAIHPKDNVLYCSLVDSTDKFIGVTPLYPGIPAMNNVDKLSSATEYNGKKKQLAMAMMMLPQINFLGIEASEKKTIVISKGYKDWRDVLQKDNKDLTIYYIDCAKSDKYFIALYANANFEDWSNGVYETSLHVFDWDGNIIYNLKVGQTLKAIAFNESHNMLFGVDVNDELYSYNLDSIN